MKIEKSTKSIITIYPLGNQALNGIRIEITLSTDSKEKIAIVSYTNLTLSEVKEVQKGLEKAIEICESGGIDLPQD